VAIISTIAITRRMRRNLIDLRFCPATGYAGLDTMRPAHFTKWHVIGMLKEQEALGWLPQEQHPLGDPLPIQGRARREGSLRCAPAR
jgi:hypothetical protein